MMSCKQYHLCWCALPRGNSLFSHYPRTQLYIARVFCSHARANVIEPKHLSLSSSSHSSARERRKQRNERREQLQADKSSWREVVEERALEKKKAAPKGLKYELDMSRLKAKGMQWWMVLVASRSEVEMAESISLALSENFPTDNFEVFVPIIPTKRKMKDGSISSSTRRLHSGCVFLRAVMSRKVHDVIKKVPRCKGFFGKKVGYHEQIIMPTPVPVEDMDGMFKKIREEEEDLQKLKELAKEEWKMRHAVKDAIKKVDKKDIFGVGSNIRVISGPYANFEGCIVGLPDEDKKVQASIMAFGEVIKVVLGLDEITLG